MADVADVADVAEAAGCAEYIRLITGRSMGVLVQYTRDESWIMQLDIKKLVGILNQDVQLPFRSGDSAKAGLFGDAASPNSDAPHPRMLTVAGYMHQAIPRKSEQPFKLRYAAFGESSNVLCAHSYAWHDSAAMPAQGAPNALSLSIELESRPVSSLTVVFDSRDSGLMAERRFPAEVAALREKHGDKLCELSAFAISRVHKSRRAIAGLMHIMFLYTRQTKHMAGVLVQARAHHAVVFQQMLDFKVLAQSGGILLLFIQTDVMRRKIRQFGGKRDLSQDDVGLYRFFFPQSDEAGLLYRVLEHLAASGTSDG